MSEICLLKPLNVNSLNWIITAMSKRSIHMQKVNITKSAEVTAMLGLLTELDSGNGGDFGGFKDFGIINADDMKDRLNSYRAQKIANYLGKNISKGYLKDFSKDRGLLVERDQSVYKLKGKFLKRLSVNEFIDINGESLLAYWQYSRKIYIDNALREFDSNHN